MGNMRPRFALTAALLAAAVEGPPSPLSIFPFASASPQSENAWQLPTNQVSAPAGRQIELPGTRPQAITLSPDGTLLAVAGLASEMIIVDPGTGTIVQRVPLPSGPSPVSNADNTELTRATGDRLSVAGLVFSSDGSRIYFSSVNGAILTFAVSPGRAVTPLKAIALPLAGGKMHRREIPAGLAVSIDGQKLYVVGNLGNRLLELDAGTGRLLRHWDVGVAPLDIVLAGGKAYVSNQGGPRPGDNDLSAPAGLGTRVKVDARSVACAGSVSVVDLAGTAPVKEVQAGLHASALAASPNGRYVVVANAGSDTLNVIATKDGSIVETIWIRRSPVDPFGAQPCALAFNRAGDRIFACNSTENAVAVIAFDPADHESRVLGLVPVGWFPAGVAYDRFRHRLWVANLKGSGAPRTFAPGEKVKYHTKDFLGSLSLVPDPSPGELTALTQRALFNLHYKRMQEAGLRARSGQPARPVPERAGEPSVFRHVIYIIKENRTYDQVLGDMTEGNGDPSLCVFGQPVTPNLHAISRQFVLLDNTYCSGVESGDGHQWTDSGFANDYVERQLSAAWPRSYPSGKTAEGADSLAWASSGFIWDDALAHGKTFHNFGEWLLSDAGWVDPKHQGKPAWLDYWHDYVGGTGFTRLASHPAIAALRSHSQLDTVGWDLHVPDVMRARKFIKELKSCETHGDLPELTVLFLPNDHTAGVRAGFPTPAAMVADNDLAMGQIIDAVSHSRFWPSTCVFAIEDDPQNGWDHVSGYRTTCYVASAYTKRHTTVSTAFNQPSVLRTIELMLGLPPMNQFDAIATPMGDCFMDHFDPRPYQTVANLTALDALNPDPRRIARPLQKAQALASARLPLELPDQCDEDELNRILWNAAKGYKSAFPAWASHRSGTDN
jgi:DNA-binding beta-propeller fold protein YncE